MAPPLDPVRAVRAVVREMVRLRRGADDDEDEDALEATAATETTAAVKETVKQSAKQAAKAAAKAAKEAFTTVASAGERLEGRHTTVLSCRTGRCSAARRRYSSRF